MVSLFYGVKTFDGPFESFDFLFCPHFLKAISLLGSKAEILFISQMTKSHYNFMVCCTLHAVYLRNMPVCDFAISRP